MRILALETSAKSVSVAVTENSTLLAQAYQDRGLTHSVTLMPLLDGMLKTAGLTLDDMDIIAVAQGPGSFTGIRIGVSDLLQKAGIGCRLASPLHRQQSAAGVALAAEHLAAQGLTCSAQELQPVYLRLSQAERERLARGLSLTAE